MNTQPCFKALLEIGRMRRFGGTAGGVFTRFRRCGDRIRKLGASGAWLCCVLLIGLGLSPSAIAQTTVTYIHTDVLGSVVAESDANGNVIKRYDYEPYGAVVGGQVTDGPGYTGHVSDSATGLIYMQQRYMDPQLGVFLSVDPVTAYEQPVGQFNRYRYANGNPYRFTDPDGRIVKYAFEGGATLRDGAAVLNHWMKSETISSELKQILLSDETYTIQFNRNGDFGYDENKRIISIDVTSGLRVKSSGEIQSPALGGGHEVSHAAQHDRVGLSAFQASLVAPQSNSESNGVMQIRVGVSSEEARATGVETRAARELGEPARKSYSDTNGTVNVCSPTSNREC
ncbi:RHS repeat domain-containing protein [Stenotrophomonas maltophilia]|uniref:RHS repeat domain-containing protein n=4 Tax=Gammaproteobacteria TaxID=1236 RepID=UPI003CCEAC56